MKAFVFVLMMLIAGPSYAQGDRAGNDFASVATTPVAQIDLSLDMAVNNSTPQVGSAVVFTLTLTNAAGLSDASGVVVTDTLPSGYIYVSDDGGAATAVAGNIVTWTVGDLAAAAQAVLNITAQVLGSGVYVNDAEVTAANEPDVDSTPQLKEQIQQQQRQNAMLTRKVEQQDKQEQPLSWQQRQDAGATRLVEQQKHETQESRQCGSDPMQKEGHRKQVAYRTCMEVIENLKREGKDYSHVTRSFFPVQSEGLVGRILYFGGSQEELIALDPFEDK